MQVLTSSIHAAAIRVREHLARLHPSVRGILWSVLAGVLFAVLNALLRLMAKQLDPIQVQFLRYGMGCVVLLPIVLRGGVTRYIPKRIGGQFLRGAAHASGLYLWFHALPHIDLADTTAIGFSVPIFIMLGSYLIFKEQMLWDRWLSALIGFGGVMLVLGPQMVGGAGQYHLLMLASAPMFALSFLIAKSLTRDERPEVIVVWLALTIAIYSFPLALRHWQWPNATQWLIIFGCGVIGSVGHYCLTRSIAAADLSATQSAKFLDLVWAALMGWLLFADVPIQTTLVGGVVIAAATVWIARREARRRETMPTLSG